MSAPQMTRAGSRRGAVGASTLGAAPGEMVEIVYGLPPFDVAEAEKRGELVIGGCVPKDVAWACRSCGARW